MDIRMQIHYQLLFKWIMEFELITYYFSND